MPRDELIHYATREGDLDQVQALVTQDPSLLELKDKEYNIPLTIAAERGHAILVQWLLDQAGANINAKGSWGQTWLNLDVVSILLNRGVDVNISNRGGQAPLMGAALKGHVAIVKLLVSQKDIDINTRDWNGRTALWKATC